MQHALVVSLIGFFGSWAIVLGQFCMRNRFASGLQLHTVKEHISEMSIRSDFKFKILPARH